MRRNGKAAPVAVAEEAREPRRMLGIRVSALLEMLCFLALALAIDARLGAGDRLSGITPHPFWIIVLLVSAQYGAREGLLAAILASAALLVGNLPEQGFSEDLHAWLLRATTEPLLWIFAAMVIGEIRDAHRRERDALRDALAEARDHAEGIGAAYERLMVVKDHLEARVAGQARTVRSIFVASRSIERQDSGQVLAGIQQLVAAVMSPRRFSLFLLDHDLLEAVLSEGWTAGDGYACAFDATTPLYQAVVSHRRHLVATRPSHAMILGTEGLLAGPLTCTETGEVIGMLKIEEMDFLELHPASVQNFRILCEWIGAAYANARRWEDSEASRHFDPMRLMLPAALFEIQRDLVDTIAARHGFDVYVLFIGFDLPEASRANLQPAVARIVARLAEGLLDPDERVFDWRRDGWDVAILVPSGGAARAGALACRLLAGLAEEMPLAGIDPALRHRIVASHDALHARPREPAA
jgi:hypothetical protein